MCEGDCGDARGRRNSSRAVSRHWRDNPLEWSQVTMETSEEDVEGH